MNNNTRFPRPLFWLVLLAPVCLGGAAYANPAADLVPGPGAVRSPGLPQAPKLFGPSLLAQGRHVYADLQRALTAALNRQATNLRVALMEARDTLQRLSASWEEAGLRAQMEIIRNDLQDRSKLADADLWDALVAELDALYAKAPPQRRAQAREAARKGREAAAKGQREAQAQAYHKAAKGRR